MLLTWDFTVVSWIEEVRRALALRSADDAAEWGAAAAVLRPS